MSLICLTTLPNPQGYHLFYVSLESKTDFVKYKVPSIQSSVIFSFIFLSVPKHNGRYLNNQLDHLSIKQKLGAQRGLKVNSLQNRLLFHSSMFPRPFNKTLESISASHRSELALRFASANRMCQNLQTLIGLVCHQFHTLGTQAFVKRISPGQPSGY